MGYSASGCRCYHLVTCSFTVSVILDIIALYVSLKMAAILRVSMPWCRGIKSGVHLHNIRLMLLNQLRLEDILTAS